MLDKITIHEIILCYSILGTYKGRLYLNLFLSKLHDVIEWEHDPAHLETINEAAVLYKAINPCF